MIGNLTEHFEDIEYILSIVLDQMTEDDLQTVISQSGKSKEELGDILKKSRALLAAMCYENKVDRYECFIDGTERIQYPYDHILSDKEALEMLPKIDNCDFHHDVLSVLDGLRKCHHKELSAREELVNWAICEIKVVQVSLSCMNTLESIYSERLKEEGFV